MKIKYNIVTFVVVFSLLVSNITYAQDLSVDPSAPASDPCGCWATFLLNQAGPLNTLNNTLQANADAQTAQDTAAKNARDAAITAANNTETSQNATALTAFNSAENTAYIVYAAACASATAACAVAMFLCAGAPPCENAAVDLYEAAVTIATGVFSKTIDNASQTYSQTLDNNYQTYKNAVAAARQTYNAQVALDAATRAAADLRAQTAYNQTMTPIRQQYYNCVAAGCNPIVASIDQKKAARVSLAASMFGKLSDVIAYYKFASQFCMSAFNWHGVPNGRFSAARP